jgi:DNA mismatch repair ATPase MutS
MALAKVAQSPGYVKPEYTDEVGGRLSVVGGRHPVLENVVSGAVYVPNDVDLGVGLDQPGSALVVTGPNMGGKSRCVGRWG